jgi:predicted signal transduction protein with EAL and GGDEF domain
MITSQDAIHSPTIDSPQAGTRIRAGERVDRAVLSLGKSLTIPVLAEGVETQAHLISCGAKGAMRCKAS